MVRRLDGMKIIMMYNIAVRIISKKASLLFFILNFINIVGFGVKIILDFWQGGKKFLGIV